ncbi:MAG TPA: hypothetical protein VLJ58_01965, partial [Ramlibacter sp.]|nr:hypothetical protein [Ramlibacter sp.]
MTTVAPRHRRRLLAGLLASLALCAAPGAASAANCFGNDRGAASLRRDDHLNWARSQGTERLVNNLRGKIAGLWQCGLPREALDDVFAQVSVLLPRYVSNPACFNGDRGALSADFQAHRSWASRQHPQRLMENLQWKAAAALQCLDRGAQAALFADLSVSVAQGAQAGPTVATPPGVVPPPPPPGATACQGFQGRWNSDFGLIPMTVSGQAARGSYPNPGGNIEGTVAGSVLTGRWIQRDRQGLLRFELVDGG